MPHIIIEHSENAFKADFLNSLLKACAQACAETQLFNPENIKVRLHPVKNFLLTKSLSNFVHIQCRTHQGRNSEQKKRLSQSLLNSVSKYCHSKTVITIEIIDMDSDSYAKQVID